MRLFIFFCALHTLTAAGQQKYWVYLKGDNNDCRINIRDLINREGLEIRTFSNWLNAYSIEGEGISNLEHACIESIAPLVQLSAKKSAKQRKLGFALNQIRANALIEAGLTGEGIKIGIIDGGFLDATKAPRLQPFFSNDQVKAYRDFVTPNLPPYHGSEHFGDDHGNLVWEMIGAKDPETKVQFGLATGADYYLARTDDGRTDFRAEEDHLVSALEWMDSLGVKLVNISIGYSFGFEDPKENYRPSDMDGKTVALTRAAQIAAQEKGMLLVIAGGNDGNNSFKVVSTPGDAKDALTVGANAYKNWQKLKYSSIGAEFLEFIKPDISCFSTQGTSFSTPIITGLAALIWEAAPHLSNLELKQLIIDSSHLRKAPNNYLGYGVPDAGLILKRLRQLPSEDDFTQLSANKKLKVSLDSGSRVVIFHKKDDTNVIAQEVQRINRNKLKLQRPDGVMRSTVVSERKVIEVIWKID